VVLKEDSHFYAIQATRLYSATWASKAGHWVYSLSTLIIHRTL